MTDNKASLPSFNEWLRVKSYSVNMNFEQVPHAGSIAPSCSRSNLPKSFTPSPRTITDVQIPGLQDSKSRTGVGAKLLYIRPDGC